MSSVSSTGDLLERLAGSACYRRGNASATRAPLAWSSCAVAVSRKVGTAIDCATTAPAPAPIVAETIVLTTSTMTSRRTPRSTTSPDASSRMTAEAGARGSWPRSPLLERPFVTAGSIPTRRQMHRSRSDAHPGTGAVVDDPIRAHDADRVGHIPARRGIANRTRGRATASRGPAWRRRMAGGAGSSRRGPPVEPVVPARGSGDPSLVCSGDHHRVSGAEL